MPELSIRNTEMEHIVQQISHYDKIVFGAINKYWARAVKSIQAKEFFAELLGTFILVLIGDASIAQVVTSNGDAGGFLTVNIGYGLGLVIALYVSIGVSGGHLNPAVTLAMAMRGKLSWLKVLPYWIAQHIGAFFGAVVVYGVYIDAISHYHNDPMNCNVTAPDYKTLCSGGIFATYPQDFLTLEIGFLDQVVGTFILLVGIFAIADSKNSESNDQVGMKPLAIGLLLWVIGTSFGYNCGYAVNPARDFSPRLFTAMAGWGKDVFTCSQCSVHHWWWVPIVAPMLGGAIAAFVYWFFIEAHHTPEVEQSSSEPKSQEMATGDQLHSTENHNIEDGNVTVLRNMTM